MIRFIHVTAVFILVIIIESTFGLEPPQDVKIVGSDLKWKPPNDDNVLYSLQYKLNSKSEDEWLNVSSHIGTKLAKFKITSEFYGAVFRVRSEKENHISEWQYSNQVQCLNVESCVPQMNLNVKAEMVHLTMAHMDDSLEKEYGDNVEFNVSYWKKDNGGYPEVQSIIISRNEDIHNLEPEQNYCFQAEYLLFNKPYGNPSEEKCEIIPERPEAVKRRAFLYSILATLLVSAMCGACIFVLFKHHKKVKQCLQPLHLEIPDHYLEVLYNGFPLEACPSPSSQSLRSYDMITVMDVEQNCQKEEQEKRSLT
ncbi:interferon gamma receptor 2 [Megalobrama amblycephala]|uniref:interferon gamma receptor 2 n=1 Tax=Megalobrama amblycephala TaxID=75352 RepID=UPI00201481E3|nr:interferon gamma receptor 2 [Megalobrama amblycephala]WRW24778.1 cytokine receptor family member B6 [Megalobrama amblycephala]